MKRPPLAPMPTPLRSTYDAARRAVPFVGRWWRKMQLGVALGTLALVVAALMGPHVLLPASAKVMAVLGAAMIALTREPWDRHVARIDQAASDLDASPLSTPDLRALRDALEGEPPRANVKWPLFGLALLALLSPALPPLAMAGLLLVYGLLCLRELPRQRDAEERDEVRLAVSGAVRRREGRDGGGPDDRPRAALPHAA